MDSINMDSTTTSQVGNYINHILGPGYSGNDSNDCSRSTNIPYVTSIPLWSDSPPAPPTTVELKLTDGRRVVETISFSEIGEISEYNDGKRRYTHVAFKRFHGKETVELDVDCSISAFMKLIGKEYTPWSKTMMEISIKDGEGAIGY